MMHRLGIPVRDRHGDVRAVEAYVGDDRVDFYLLGRLRASFDRDQLRKWLSAKPAQPLIAGEVIWSAAPDGTVRLEVRGLVAPAPVTNRSIHWLVGDPA